MKNPLMLALLLAAAPLGAQEQPNLSGAWTINRKLSENVETKIDDVAGPDDVKGHKPFGPEGHPGLGILPVAGLGKDVDRVMLRRLILAAAETLDRIEIDVSENEIKHVDALDNVRIFYLNRDHVRIGRNDEKVKCHTEWRGDKLVITQDGESAKLVEALGMLPTRDQLVYSVRLEDGKLKKPLELTLVYDRAEK